ncbi:glycosyl transferase family protein [Tolypothrix tenuis PCC 7101]|uniref:Glycosyl transferase family protein n=1 Tax=Tolypothrix tenuis PCC 7101 TaxID=231146 RepID=A0A1Z4N2Z1_9CYAN|nr:glycosyltransferase family 2 protein [Aulosira sp. FACHB-113]BAZ00061.1 glycosyl transferase family protein [Tolypothrix tenuis PCC 7101]BAZ76018.1 glycosyl transferase family protein [Aulosira laxa NIES-50]
MPDIQISAIICTHNRDTYLGAAIDSLLAQDFAAEFEVVVVDNNSSDRTKEVVAQRASNPRLKYVFEPTTGLSVARNTGAKLASGEILAYLDDDAVASDRWLSVFYDAYKNNSQLAIAGGKVTLLWPQDVQQPRWLSPGLAANLGAYDLGDSIIYIDKPSFTPRGLNYCIRRSFLEEIGGFDPHLGRVGKNLLSNEELQMTEFALQKGWQVAYLPAALVAHNVAPERLKRSWFLNRGWWQGISECYREQLAGKAGISQLQRGGERFIRGLYKALQYFSDPAERFDKLVYAYGQIGYLNAAIQGLLSTANKK